MWTVPSFSFGGGQMVRRSEYLGDREIGWGGVGAEEREVGVGGCRTRGVAWRGELTATTAPSSSLWQAKGS